MAKSYFKFQEHATFGHIATSLSNFQVSSQRALFTAANESVLQWSLRTGISTAEFKEGTEPVTCLSLSTHSLAVGHQDGALRVWDLDSQVLKHSFEGHKAAVSALAYHPDGLSIASGSLDTCIILWDLVADAPTLKLQGHKDMITSLLFVGERLYSGSKDHLVKVWDVATESSVDTLVHSREVWSFAHLPDGSLLVGCADLVVHIWKQGPEGYSDVGSFGCEAFRGFIRTVALHPNGHLVLVQSASKHFAVYRIRPEAEIQKMEKRRHKRLREKGKSEETTILPSDHYQLLHAGKAEDKIIFAAFLPRVQKGKERELKASIALSLSNNQIVVYTLEYNHSKSTKLPGLCILAQSLSHAGHRSAVRCLCLSPDASTLLSGSGDSVKVWDLQTCSCTGSLSSAYVVSGVCVPDGRHIVVGCKSGLLQAFDLLSLQLVQEKQGHSGSVWGLTLTPNNQAIVSGGADQQLKFWTLNIRNEHLHLKLVDSMTLKDEVLAVSYTPNGKFLCVSLLNCNVEVLRADTRKVYFTLHAHTLPVTCFDVSSDSQLLLSGSADKSVKIWDLDFGHYTKSILAHDQSIMAVKFVPDTHYFFSASKDRLIKYWDADRFQLILTLKGHCAEVWALAISPRGDFLVSAAGDHSIRVWKQTDEQTFLIEAREQEIEDAIAPEDLGIVPNSSEAAMVISTSQGALKESELLIEALDNPAAGETTVLKALHQIRSSTLESTLQLLPYHYVPVMLQSLLALSKAGRDVELLAQCTQVLLSIHESTIACALYTGEWLGLLDALKEVLRSQLSQLRNNIGRNIAATHFITANLQDAQTN